MSDHGPQHSTPVKESFLSNIQRGEKCKHPLKTGRVAELSDVKVNHASHRHFECELLHHVDDHNDASSKSDIHDSIIDISKISEIQNSTVHGNDISDTAHDDDNVTISCQYDLNCTETHSSLHTKQISAHQNQHSSIHNSSPSTISFEHGKLENGNTFNRHDAVRNVHAGTQYSRPLPSDCFSDSDLSKQSSSPRTTLSYMKVALSPSNQRMVKYRRVRSSSLPRSLLADVNVCNSVDYNLPGCSVSDFRRTPAVYIEQDIINKQRQEIQLLMEELGNRDQELNDLVMSHQKQVKAWESDNEKLVALQGRLSHYEEELSIRENQLKETLSEMARVNEQREVDAVELKRTQNEMIKLAERIMENSLYIKEMEAQNQKLSFSLRDFVTARQSFSAREQELLLLIEEKDLALAERQKEIEKMVEHIKYLECQCEQLGERNNNTVVESVNWKKKYCQVKEEADRLSADCRLKEENVQKMTQQLHESLQQAIALQKALFTSCEREKCKEEVMYSLRKQHKRTMQELQNIRELYDRLSRDTTLYHLSVKDKDSAKDVKKRDDLDGLSKKLRGDNPKHDEEADKRRQGGNRRHEANMSKLKHPEASEQSFLVKETKERKPTKEEKSGEKSTSKASDKNVVEQKISKSDNSRSYKSKADEPEDHVSKLENIRQTTPQKLMERNTAKVYKNEQQVSTPIRSCHTTMCRNAATITSSTSVFSEEVNAQRLRVRKSGGRMKSSMGDSKCSETEAVGHENTSKNADFKDTRSLTSSHNSTAKSVQSRTTSPFAMQAAPNKHDASIVERSLDVEGNSSSDASNIVSPSRFDDELTPADSDGMCHELQRDMSRVHQLDRLSPMLEASGFESRSSRTTSNSLAAPKKSSFLKKDKTEKKDSAAAVKHNTKKRSVEFDATDDLSKSVSAETHSQYLAPESESYSPPTAERRPCIVTRGNMFSNTQQYGSSNCQGSKRSPGGREENGPQHCSEASNMKSHPPDNVYIQGRGRCLHDTGEPEHKQEINSEYGHKNNLGSALLRQKGQMEENSTSQWSLGSCSQCKAQGKGYCNCSMVQRSHPAFANHTMGNYEGDLSKNDVRYSCPGGLASATSKLTFSEIDSLLEYNSSLSKSQNRQLQSEKGRMQMCSSPDEVNSAAFHHSDQKTHVNVLDDEPVHDQSVLIMSHKISCQDLPERITTYLANHSSIRREMYNNNNNTSTDDIMNFDLCSNSEICKHEQKTQLQEENLVTCVDYIFDDIQGDSLPASFMLPSVTEDGSDYGIINDKKNIQEKYRQQETCFNNVKVENVFQEAVGKKKREEVNLNTCLPASSGFENKHAVNGDTLVGSSKLSDHVNVPELVLHTGSKDFHPEHLSCHVTTKLVTESRLHLKDLDLNSRDERLCESSSGMKGKHTVGFSKATSAPACSVSIHSASTREPSLYKHLSLIHFSEATRRYEWIRHPALLEHKIPGENLHISAPDGNNSTKNKLSDFKTFNMIHTVSGQPQDSIMPDITDSRSDSQSSDSGHYSLSVGSADHSFHLGKPSDYRDHRANVDSSHVYKSHTDQMTCSPTASNKITNNNSEQYNDPNNNNNNNSIKCDVSHLKWSPTEIFTSPHSSLKKFDDVVKKLDFNDTFLDDSKAEKDSLVITLSCQHCLPGNDKHEAVVQDKISSKILPAATNIRCDYNQCSCISKERRDELALPSIVHDSPKYIDPGQTISCHDHNIQRLMSLSPVGTNDELKVEGETCADITENDHFLTYSLGDVNVKEIKENAFSSQNRRNMNKQKGSNENEIEANEVYFEGGIHEVSNLSALAEEYLEEVNGSHRHFNWAKTQRISHRNKHILVHEEDCCNHVKTIYDLKTQWDAEKNQEIIQDGRVDQPDVQHYNIVFYKPAEGTLEDTRDGSGSVDFQAGDTSGAAVWEFEDSVEELPETCDDDLSAFLDVSTESDESVMGTALSPVSKLYRLLVESQEMINSLEKNSSVPEAVDLLESLTN